MITKSQEQQDRYHRKWRDRHPGYMKKYLEEWRKAHPEYHKKYYERSGNNSLQVYVIQNTVTGRIKIGKGAGKTRLKQLQGSVDVELVLLRAWRDPQPFELETKWKDLLESLRVRGEWYESEALPMIDSYMAGRNSDRIDINSQKSLS